jgi:hypothetical protein
VSCFFFIWHCATGGLVPRDYSRVAARKSKGSNPVSLSQNKGKNYLFTKKEFLGRTGVFPLPLVRSRIDFESIMSTVDTTVTGRERDLIDGEHD